jgi:hypothetical protein
MPCLRHDRQRRQHALEPLDRARLVLVVAFEQGNEWP